MVCKNCGATMDENEVVCPYCGTENFEVAKKQQEEYVKEYRHKKKVVKTVPERFVRKTTKTMFYIAGGVLAAIILLLIVAGAFSRVASGALLATQKKELEKLEKYYSAGDYEAMCDYLESIHKWGGSYEKYDRIYRLYMGMDWKIEAIKSNLEYVGIIELDASDVESDIERCIAELAKITEMEKLGFPYGEKEGVLFIKSQYTDTLKTYAFLTDAEIESAVSIYKEDGNDYLELAEISIQRMEENVR